SAGDLDLSFGHRGLVVDRHYDAAVAVATQPAGRGRVKLIVADPSGIRRFSANGSMDASFGTHGRVGGKRSAQWLIHAMTVQADGKILALLTIRLSMYPLAFVARFTADGKPDPTFGANHNGRVSIADASGRSASDFWASDLALEP